jgi:hypothetical protein
VRVILIKLGAELKSDNIYEHELKNGSRAAEHRRFNPWPDGGRSDREAARLSPDLITAPWSDCRVAPNAGPPPASAVSKLSLLAQGE